MENLHDTPQGSVFKFPAQQSQTGPSESFAKTFRDMDCEAVADMIPSHMHVREENLFNKPVHEVSLGDPDPPPRLGRRLLRRHLDEAAPLAYPSPRPDSSAATARSAQSWQSHVSAPAGADPSSSYASGVPTQMYEEIQMNATNGGSPYTPPSEQESNFRNRYKPKPPPPALTATNWRRQPHPPRRRRASFKLRPGPTPQPRRLFEDDVSAELDDFTDNIFSESETDNFAPEQRLAVSEGPEAGARMRFEPTPAAYAYASPVPGPSGLQPPPHFSSPCGPPDCSSWSGPQAASPARAPPTAAPCRGKGKAIPGKPLRAKRGRAPTPPDTQLGDGNIFSEFETEISATKQRLAVSEGPEAGPVAGPEAGARMWFEPTPAAYASASPVPGPSGLQPPPHFSSPSGPPDCSSWSGPQAARPAPAPPAAAPCRGKGKAIPGKPLRAKRGRAPTPPDAQLGDGLLFHPTGIRPWTAPSMFSQQDWNTSCLPDNYYPTYCRGPLPKNYECDEAYK